MVDINDNKTEPNRDEFVFVMKHYLGVDSIELSVLVFNLRSHVDGHVTQIADHGADLGHIFFHFAFSGVFADPVNPKSIMSPLGFSGKKYSQLRLSLCFTWLCNRRLVRLRCGHPSLWSAGCWLFYRRRCLSTFLRLLWIATTYVQKRAIIFSNDFSFNDLPPIRLASKVGPTNPIGLVDILYCYWLEKSLIGRKRKVATHLLQGRTQSPQHFSMPARLLSASFMSALIWSIPSSIRSSCSVYEFGTFWHFVCCFSFGKRLGLYTFESIDSWLTNS